MVIQGIDTNKIIHICFCLKDFQFSRSKFGLVKSQQIFYIPKTIPTATLKDVYMSHKVLKYYLIHILDHPYAELTVMPFHVCALKSPPHS